MNISQKGIDLIKKYEGCRLSAYKCPAGVWTIGYGHTAGVRPGDVITQEEAEDYLRGDLLKFEMMVNSYNDRYAWTQPQFDALVSFAYNIGNITGVTAAGTRTKTQIANAMLLYVRAAGKILNGLVRRRNEEYSMFMSDPEPILKSNNEIADEVIKGLWGVGEERKKKLRAAGYNPGAIQRIVNNKLKK